MIASGGGGTIRVFDVASRALRAPFRSNAATSNRCGSRRTDGRSPRVAATESSSLWDLASQQGWTAVPRRVYDATAEKPVTVGLWCVAYSPDGRWLATSARDGAIEIFDASITPQRTLVPNVGNHGAVSGIAFSRDGGRMAVSRHANKRSPGSFQIWDVAGRRPVLLTDVRATDAHSVAFSADQLQLAVGDAGKVEIVDAESGRRQLQIELPQGWAACKVHFAADGTLYVARGSLNSDQMALSAYDVKTGQEIQLAAEPFYHLQHLGAAFSRRDDLVATLHPERSSAICLYELPTGRLRVGLVWAPRFQQQRGVFTGRSALGRFGGRGRRTLEHHHVSRDRLPRRPATRKWSGGILRRRATRAGNLARATGRARLGRSPSSRQLLTLPLPNELSFPRKTGVSRSPRAGQKVALRSPMWPVIPPLSLRWASRRSTVLPSPNAEAGRRAAGLALNSPGPSRASRTDHDQTSSPAAVDISPAATSSP